MSDAKEELTALRRLAELEGKAQVGQSDSTLSDLKAYGPGFLAEAGKSVARGGTNLLIGGLDALSAGSLDPDTLKSIPNPLVEKLRQGSKDLLGEGDGSYLSRGLEGVGSMLGPGNAVARAVSGLASGFGGKAAGEAAAKVDPKLAPVGEFLGSTLGGVGPAMALTGQRQSENILRKALDGATPQDWRQASANLRDFKNSGATTGTLVDALNKRNGLVATANELRNSPGGEAFNARVNGRGDDLLSLGDEFVYRTNPPNQGPVQPNNPLAVANKTSDAANAVLEQARKERTAAYQAELAGKKVPAREVASVYSRLMQTAENPSRPDAVRAAYKEAANAFTKHEGSKTTAITQLSDLGSNVKSLKANPPGENVSTGAKIDSGIYRQALREAEDALKELSPAYAKANASYAKTSQEVIRPLREGIIGKVRDVVPTSESPTPVARLDALLGKDNSTTAIAEALTQLSGQGANPRDILQAVAQRKLDTGATDPGATMRGAPGSFADTRLGQVINSTGLPASQVTQPLRAADNLQNFQNPPVVLQNNENRSFAGALLTPFRRGEFELTQAMREKNSREMAAILSRHDEAGLRQLQEIAAFNPEVRKQLAAQLLLVNGVNSGER